MPEEIPIIEQNPGTKTIVESIPEPVGNFAKDFVKYSLPGVLTQEELTAGAEKLNRLHGYIKEKDYRRSIGTGLQVLGHALMAAVGLAPFAGTSKPLIKVWTAHSGQPIASESGAVFKGFTMDGPKPKKVFTAGEFLQQGTKRFERTIKDAEYQEALRKQFPEETAKLLSDSQLKEASRSVLNPAYPDDFMNFLETSSQEVTMPSGYICSFSELESWLNQMIKESGLNLTPKQYAKQHWGVSEQLWDKIAKKKPEIRLNDDAVQVLIDQNVINQEELRKLMFHEQVHAGGQAGERLNTFITQHNANFPVKIKPGVRQYYAKPGELRARAMSLRRLYQTTGKPYKQLLEEYETNPGLYRTDPNIDDLIEYYDRESLLNYLNNFLKDGGTINYLNFFK